MCSLSKTHLSVCVLTGLMAAMSHSVWAGREWFPSMDREAESPFDLAVRDVWATDPRGQILRDGAVVAEGTPLQLHCAWAVYPTEFVDVAAPMAWTENEISINNSARGLFAISLPAGKYGSTTWKTGELLGVVEDQSSHRGAKEFTGKSQTTWSASGPGLHTLRCALDVKNQTRAAEKNLSNNTLRTTIKVVPSVVRVPRFTPSVTLPTAMLGTPSLGVPPAVAPVKPPIPSSTPTVSKDANITKSCREALRASLEVDSSEFADPAHGPADMARAQLTLHLKKSEATANNVNCYYASKHEDVPSFVVTLKCLNASRQEGAAHSYQCAP